MIKENYLQLRQIVDNPHTFMRSKEVHERDHAKDLDKRLGYRISKIEEKLLQKYRAYYKSDDKTNKKKHFGGTQTWIGLHPQALQTTYNEIFDALYTIREFPIKRVVDIGSGYGRVGLVMNSIFPSAEFIGLEILKQREFEGNRIFEKLKLSNCKIILENVLEKDFVLPKAEVYFMYDFSEKEDICKILDILSTRLTDDNFFLITKGDRIDFLLEKKYKEFWSSNGFLSSGDLKIYSSRINLE